MPSTYYKYRPINEYSFRFLQHQEVYFEFGSEYNDPFDSKVRIDSVGTTDEMIASLDRTPLSPETKRRMRQRIFGGDFTPEQHQFAAYEIAKRTVMSSCYSSNCSNILLWSHYADSHKGFCAGFKNVSGEDYPAIKFDMGPIPGDPATIINGVFPIYEVKYDRDEITKWRPFHENISVFMDAHTHKANLWKYEEEHRVLLAHGEYNTQILRFDKRFLTEVYLGSRMEPDVEVRIREIVREEYWDKGFPVKLYRMNVSPVRYELYSVEIERGEPSNI